MENNGWLIKYSSDKIIQITTGNRVPVVFNTVWIIYRILRNNESTVYSRSLGPFYVVSNNIK